MMKAVLVLPLLALVCCVVVEAQPQIPQIPGGPAVLADLGDRVKENIPNVPDVPIPGAGAEEGAGESEGNCLRSGPIVAYLNCCGPRKSCDLSSVTTSSITASQLKRVSCEALQALSELETLLPTIIMNLPSKASSCLSSTLGDFFQKVHGSPSNWEMADLESIPASSLATLNLTSLSDLPESFFKSEKSRKKLGESMKNMTIDQISQGMVPNLKKAYGAVSGWSADTVQELMADAPRAVCGMSPSDIEEMSTAAVTASIDEVAEALSSCHQEIASNAKSKARSVLKKYSAEKGAFSTWTGDTLNGLKGLKEELSVPSLWSMAEMALTDTRTMAHNDTILSAAQKAAITATVKSRLQDSVQTPIDQAKEVLKKLPTALTTLQGSDIKALDCPTLAKYLLQSASKKVPKLSMKAAVQRAIAECELTDFQYPIGKTPFTASGLESITSTNIKTLIPYAGGLTTADLDKLQLQQAFTDVDDLDSLIPDDLSVAQGQKMLMKVSEGTMALGISKFSKLAKFMTLGDELTPRITLDEIKKAGEKGLDVSKSMASEFADKALATLGKDWTDTDRFPSNTIFNDLGEAVVKGFNRTTFRDLPSNGLLGFASQAARFELTAGQTHEMAKRVSVDQAKTFSEQIVRDLGKVVAHFNDTVVEALPTGSKAQYARNLGQTDKLLGFAGDEARLTSLADKAIGWLKGSKGGSLTHSDLQGLGTLQHYLPEKQLRDMKGEDLEASLGDLSGDVAGEAMGERQQRLSKVAKVAFEKLKNGRSEVGGDVIRSLGNASCYLPDAYFNTLNTKAKFDEVLETLGDSDCAPTSQSSKTAVMRAKEHYTSGTGRMGKMPGHVLRTLNNALPAMTVTDIQDLPADTIKDELETFGKAPFTAAQSMEIVKKIFPTSVETGSRLRRQTASGAGALTSAEVEQLGRLACAMKPRSLASYMTTADTLCSLSKETCYTAQQKQEFISMLKSTTPVSGWTSFPTACLGQWASALTAADIQSLPSAVFKKHADVLGKIHHPTQQARKALATKALSAYGGQIKGLKEGVVNFLGNITGYLDEPTSKTSACSSEIQQMTSDQIAFIDPSVIPQMMNLRCLTAEQLRALDGQQARAVTPDQRSTFSSLQVAAVTESSCQPGCAASTGGSGASSLTAAVLVTVAAMFAALLF